MVSDIDDINSSIDCIWGEFQRVCVLPWDLQLTLHVFRSLSYAMGINIPWLNGTNNLLFMLNSLHVCFRSGYSVGFALYGNLFFYRSMLFSCKFSVPCNLGTMSS